MTYSFTSNEEGPLDRYSLLLVRLTAVVLRGRLHEDSRHALEETRREVREIGQLIFLEFGMDGMSTANNALFALNGRASAAVDKYWDGIGEWLT